MMILDTQLELPYRESAIANNKPTNVLPEYTRVDVAAWRTMSENTMLQVIIKNLTDELYFPHSHSKYAPGFCW